MSLWHDRHRKELRSAGWHTRGFLPHFDDRPRPQFITFHLGDAIPLALMERWREAVRRQNPDRQKILLQRRIERYADYGHGNAFLKLPRIAQIIQNSLLKFDEVRYRLFSWVVMPNHVHLLMTRFDGFELSRIMHSIKSFTAHEANKTLDRSGEFWMPDYFDRYIRSQRHFDWTVRYIENNPVKARLCRRPEDWLFGSARFRQIE